MNAHFKIEIMDNKDEKIRRLEFELQHVTSLYNEAEECTEQKYEFPETLDWENALRLLEQNALYINPQELEKWAELKLTKAYISTKAD